MTAHDPVLLFGIGAQKAGTDWLYDTLSGHPDCALRPIRELYYFNLLRRGGPMEWTRSLWARRLSRLHAQLKTATADARPDIEAEMARLEDWIRVRPGDHDAYLDYLCAERGNASVVADITPSYALLGREEFGLMAALRPRTRFIYLLRDPVDRLWANCQARASQGAVPETGDDPAGGLLDRVLDGKEPALAARCDYARTLMELYETVPADRIHVAFHEDLGSEQAQSEICRFLGIEPRVSNLPTGTDGAPLDDTRRALAREWLDGQYLFVTDFMGDRVPPSWGAA